MTDYLPTTLVTTLTTAVPTATIISTEDDLTGTMLTIELICDDKANFAIQYDKYGDGELWINYGDVVSVNNEPKVVSFVGKGKTQIIATETSALSSVKVTCKITAELAPWGVTYDDVRAITDLTTSDITNNEIQSSVLAAGSRFNQDICAKIKEEFVWRIDNYRMNYRNGTNTSYYALKSWDYYFGDLNDDGYVDINDVEAWDYDPSTKTKTAVPLTAIDERGMVTTSYPIVSGHWLKLTYRYMPLSITHPLCKRAVTELAAAFSYSKIEARESKKISLGRLSVMRTPIGTKQFMDRYYSTVKLIWARDHMRKVTGTETSASLDPYRLEPAMVTGPGGQPIG